MTVSLLMQVREKQAEATRKALEPLRKNGLPRQKPERVRLARDLGQLIAQEVALWQHGGREMVRKLIKEAADRPPEQINLANDLLHRYLDIVIRVCSALRGIAGNLTAAGHRVVGVKSLTAVIAECERWREDLPEQLALASRPVRSVLRARVAQALERAGGNWKRILVGFPR
jgi:hypothetical protein